MNAFLLLFQIKQAMLRNTLRQRFKRSKFEFFSLIFFFLAATGGLFLFFLKSFRFFEGQEPFGPILIDETFYLFNFAVFTMLLISSGVSAYSSLFRSGEVPFLITRPTGWTDIYFLKLTEALWQSSWSLFFVALPFMTAFGMIKGSEWWFPVLCLFFYVPFMILTCAIGTFISTLTVWFLPSRRRRTLALILILGGISYLFFKAQPQLIREQGSIAGIMSGYLPHVAFAKNPALPSSWLSQGILAASNFNELERYHPEVILFNFLLLLSNALFFFTPSYFISFRLYPAAFLKAQDHGETRKLKKAGKPGIFEKIFDALPWPSKPALGFLEKDIKTFVRDPAEWSQLLIFFGLLFFYFINLRNLQFHVLKDFWKNMVFILNTIGTFVVLSSFSMRFVFPMLSMEGAKYWMVGVAPVRKSTILMEKFLMGCALSMFLTLPLVFLSGKMLEISNLKILYTLILGFFVCIALTGLSVGLGAKFISLKADNPAQVISGFGGAMLLISHMIFLTGIGTFLFVSKNPTELVLFAAAASSLLIGAFTIKIGMESLKKLEF